MRAASEIMAELAASGLDAKQIALVMELSAAVATEARPIVDSAAEKKREYDRNYQRSRRTNRTKSYDSNDPPKENISNPPSAPNGAGSAEPDPVKDLFDLGVSMLTSQGHTEKQARNIIGSWRKGRSAGDVAAALLEARTKAISNLVEWMPKRLDGSRFKPPEPIPLWKHLRDQEQRQLAAKGPPP